MHEWIFEKFIRVVEYSKHCLIWLHFKFENKPELENAWLDGADILKRIELNNSTGHGGND